MTTTQDPAQALALRLYQGCEEIIASATGPALTGPLLEEATRVAGLLIGTMIPKGFGSEDLHRNRLVEAVRTATSVVTDLDTPQDLPPLAAEARQQMIRLIGYLDDCRRAAEAENRVYRRAFAECSDCPVGRNRAPGVQ